MRNNKNFIWTVLMVLASTAIVLSGCKKTFDEPPAYIAPNIKANTTIAQLKAMHVTGRVEAITTDLIIRGIVNADDRSGNYYKQISIQDSTAGITVRLDGSSLYTQYPVGREVFIKLNGLYMGDYNGLIQLGGSPDNTSTPPNVLALASNLFDKYIVKGSTGNVIVPKDVTVATLNNSYQSMLVRLTGAEVVNADTAKTWANATTQSSANINVKQCTGANIIVRTSGYSSFAGINVPNGNGNLLAIYTVFGNTPQLIIRDTSDASLHGVRCDGNLLLNEGFETQTANTTVAITGWQNIAETGGVLWQAKTFNSNLYAQMSAFGSNQATVKTWLVSKGVNMNNTINEQLSFETIAGYHNGATLKVMVSTNYTGTGNPWAAGVTWTDLTAQATLSPGLTTGYPSAFTPSGNIALGTYTGTLYVAFVYEGADPTGTASDRTTTWQVDNVKIAGF